MAAGISIKNISKTIKNKVIIEDFSLEIKKGEVLGFLGPNGAGKTTTIRMLVGLMSVTSGDILIDGRSIIKEKKQAVKKIGAIVENPDLYNFMSGLDNLKYFAKLQTGISRKRINEVVEMVGLSSKIDEKVKTYSLGMKQRLGLAQSLLHSPQVLILDEPTNGLDPSGIREFRQYIRNLAKQHNLTIIVSSHLLSEIELMCDRVAIIQDGKLIKVENLKKGKETNSEEIRIERTVIEVSNANEAAKFIASINPGLEVETFGTFITINTVKENLPDIIENLVIQKYKIFEVKRAAKSLEDRFLEITEKGEKLNA